MHGVLGSGIKMSLDSFTITEVDDEELDTPVIDLAEVRKRKEYEEFWSDPCWSEPIPTE